MATTPIEIRINPKYEAMLPPLTTEEYNRLYESIRDTGLYNQIVINEKGEILDGHNRFKITKALGKEASYVVKQFPNELEEEKFVIESNLHRRQLTLYALGELVLRLKPIYQRLAKANMSAGGKGAQINTPLGRTNERLAQMVGMSATTLSKVEAISKRDNEDIKKKLRSDRTLSIDYVYHSGMLPKKSPKQNSDKEETKEQANEVKLKNVTISMIRGIKLTEGGENENSEVLDEWRFHKVIIKKYKPSERNQVYKQAIIEIIE